MIVGRAMSWGRMALLSSLAGDYLVHLGVENASESDKLTRSMTVTGALVWMLFICQQTNWSAWPLQVVGRRNLESVLLLHGFTLIYTITLIQVTALVISAARQSTVVLAEMDREDQEERPASAPVRRLSRCQRRVVARRCAATEEVTTALGSRPPAANLPSSGPDVRLHRSRPTDRRAGGFLFTRSAQARAPRRQPGGKQLAQRSGQRKMHVLFADRFFVEGRAEVPLEVLDALLHDVLRRAGAGRDQDRFNAREPLIADLGDAVDQVGGNSQPVGDLGQPPAVRAVLAPQHEHQSACAARSRTASWRFWVA